jgi:hypothetical protein
MSRLKMPLADKKDVAGASVQPLRFSVRDSDRADLRL